MHDLAFSPDGATLAAGSYDIRQFNLKTGALRINLAGHRQGVTTLAFSRDGSQLATGGAHSPVHVWAVSTGKHLQEFRFPGHGVSALAYSPNGSRLVAGMPYQGVSLWNTRTQGLAARHRSERSDGKRAFVTFSPDGKRLVWGSEKGPLRLLNPISGARVGTLPRPADRIVSLTFGGDGTLCMATKKEIHFLHTNSLEKRRLEWNPWGIGQAVWSSEAGIVAACELGRGVVLLDSKTGKIVRRIEDSKRLEHLAISVDGRLLAGAGARRVRIEVPGKERPGILTKRDGVVRIWEVRTGRAVGEIAGHRGAVSSVAFSPDGKMLATGAADTTVLLWDLSKVLGR